MNEDELDAIEARVLFVNMARIDVPRLVAEVRRLQFILNALRDGHDLECDYCNKHNKYIKDTYDNTTI